MREPLTRIPAAPRVADYFGMWLVEQNAAAAMWETATRMDWAAHMAAWDEGGRDAGPPKPYATGDVMSVGNGRNVLSLSVGGLMMKQASSLGGTSTVALRRDIRKAAADPSVNAILLAIDSPGGTVKGLMDLANEVKSARRKKPLWAFIDDLGASAAYWVASQADVVYANNPTALVGSIGTVMTVYDASAAAERSGVKAMVFATGPIKGAGTPGTQITPEQAAYFQRLVDETQQHFDAAVVKGRGLKAAELAAARTGEVFMAERALSMRLIDGIKPVESVIDALAAAAK